MIKKIQPKPLQAKRYWWKTSKINQNQWNPGSYKKQPKAMKNQNQLKLSIFVSHRLTHRYIYTSPHLPSSRSAHYLSANCVIFTYYTGDVAKVSRTDISCVLSADVQYLLWESLWTFSFPLFLLWPCLAGTGQSLHGLLVSNEQGPVTSFGKVVPSVGRLSSPP